MERATGHWIIMIDPSQDRGPTQTRAQAWSWIGYVAVLGTILLLYSFGPEFCAGMQDVTGAALHEARMTWEAVFAVLP